MDKIIHSKIKLHCRQQQSFAAFIKNSNVQIWLAKRAYIEPYVGVNISCFGIKVIKK